MPSNNKAVNGCKRTLIKPLERVHTGCLRVELAKEQVASIHRTAERNCPKSEEASSTLTSSRQQIRPLYPGYPCPRGGFVHKEAFGIYRKLYPDAAVGVAHPHDIRRLLDALGPNRHVEVGAPVAYFDRNLHHRGHLRRSHRVAKYHKYRTDWGRVHRPGGVFCVYQMAYFVDCMAYTTPDRPRLESARARLPPFTELPRETVRKVSIGS